MILGFLIGIAFLGWAGFLVDAVLREDIVRRGEDELVRKAFSNRPKDVRR